MAESFLDGIKALLGVKKKPLEESQRRFPGGVYPETWEPEREMPGILFDEGQVLAEQGGVPNPEYLLPPRRLQDNYEDLNKDNILFPKELVAHLFGKQLEKSSKASKEDLAANVLQGLASLQQSEGMATSNELFNEDLEYYSTRIEGHPGFEGIEGFLKWKVAMNRTPRRGKRGHEI